MPRPIAAKKRALQLMTAGLSERDTMAKLASEGVTVSKGSLNNWKREAAGKAPRTAAPAKATVEGSAEGWEGVDLVHLPAALLEQTAKRVTAKITETLGSKICDYQLLGKLVQTQQLLAKELVMARPPETPDPETDPLNLSARDELRERLSALRDETEVTPPAVEAVRAYLADLERRVAEQAPKAAEGTETDAAA